MISGVKAAMLDLAHQDDYVDPVINISNLPDVDPWSKEGQALARFEQLRDNAIEAADLEREANDAIWMLKKQLRKEALARGESSVDLGDAPDDIIENLRQLTDDSMNAKEAKLAASVLAQEARVSFDALMSQKVEDEALQANEDAKLAIKTRLNSPS